MSRYGRLLGVCDIVRERADAFAARFGANAYYNLDELLAAADRPDLIAVCTPNGLHASHSITILSAGMHVLCEKPMAITVCDCQEMIAAAEKAGKKLFVVKQNRFNPPLLALKKILDEGKLGRLYSFQLNGFWNRPADYYKDSWRGTKKWDGGTLFTQFSHFIDLLYWLIGDVRDVHALLANYAHRGIIEFEDTGMVIMEFADGVSGTMNYTVNSYGQNMEGSLTLFAEKGTVKVGGQYLNKLEYQCIDHYVIEKIPEGKGANDYGLYQGSMSNHDKVYENINRYVQGRGDENVSAADGMKTVEIIEMIYKKATWIHEEPA